ncbi:MAG: AraC family transcriptional regulator [Alphaproteobacteria bacterium]|nr:AraC family transcriptional regulator [Alphaproteobacteria bacterium]
MARVDTRNRTRFWQDPAVPGLSLLHADFAGHDYAPHSHDALVVAVTEVGGAEFTSRGATQEALVRHVLVFNPDEPHSGRMARSRRWRYRSLYLDERAIAGVAARVGLAGTPYFTTNLLSDPGLADRFLAVHRARDDAGDGLRADELLVAAFGLLIGRHGGRRSTIPPAPRDAAALARAIATMRDRHAEPLTLDGICGPLGFTPFQLIGLFKRGTGLTPHAYLTQVRLRAAARRMAEGMAIAEAALASGFYDQSALTRHFKRSYGITPLQYLRGGARPPVPGTKVQS